MEIKKIIAAFFSPAGSTKKLVMEIAEEFSSSLHLPLRVCDFTRPAEREKDIFLNENELLILGTPVYAGRIPNKILPYIQEHIRGSEALAFPLVSYGNRAFDDTLSELIMELRNHGFSVLGAGAFPSEHVMSPRLAPGRPDAKDLNDARHLAHRAAVRLEAIPSPSSLKPARVSGNTPPGPYYVPLTADGRPAKFLKAKPKTHPELCAACGICAEVCPMGSINTRDCITINGICIKCHACIRACAAKAKYFDDLDLLSHIHMLETKYTRPLPVTEYIF